MADRSQVLFLTSFGPDLFDVSGRNMLKSFYNTNGNGRMLVCYENSPGRDLGVEIKAAFPQAELYSLDEDQFLHSWLNDNIDIIPEHLGGLAKPCSCPDRHRRHGHHKYACHYQWMNRNASRWFRKVAAWRYATTLSDAKWMLWVDSDCVVRLQPTLDQLKQIIGKHAMAYCRGPIREAIESGLLAFNLDGGGRKVIDAICKRYATKDFRRFHRWDDGFIVTTVVNEMRDMCHDLVPTTFKDSQDVAPSTVWAQYMRHVKGLHGRLSNTMK